MFEAELDNVKHLLAEVRVAGSVAVECEALPEDLEEVRSRGQEVKAVGLWCHQEGGEV